VIAKVVAALAGPVAARPGALAYTASDHIGIADNSQRVID
jgi:hypothetical protein